jgi:hypothetical protein
LQYVSKKEEKEEGPDDEDGEDGEEESDEEPSSKADIIRARAPPLAMFSWRFAVLIQVILLPKRQLQAVGLRPISLIWTHATAVLLKTDDLLLTVICDASMIQYRKCAEAGEGQVPGGGWG